MGNKLGGQKPSKSKEEKKHEKEPGTKHENEEKTRKKSTQKEKKERKIKKKEKTKKADGKSKHSFGRYGDHNSGTEFDTDFESSHVTGGDSESGVFHSAENLSSSPYLDSHTRSELEHSGTWSALYESSLTSRHPQVLSSRDFRDGFSLEACIPPEIARRDTNLYDHDAGNGSGSGSHVFSYSNSSSLKSKRSNSSKSARMTPISTRHHPDDLMSVSTSSSQKSCPAGREGYSTPLLTTPVFGRVDRSHSPTSPSGAASTLSRVQEADRDSMDIVSLSRSPFDPNAKVYTTYNLPAHLAHLYQHPPQTSFDYRNLPKPTSPHPQRRALSPKMTSTPFKIISSDDSSSSPSTPVLQRKTGNILVELLRTGRGGGEKRKQQKAKVSTTSEKDENGARTSKDRKSLAEVEEMKKSKGLSMWKTWERSNKKKAEKSSKASIFGTARKTKTKSDKRYKNDSSKEGDIMSEEDNTADRLSDSTLKDLNIAIATPATHKMDNSYNQESGDNTKQRPYNAGKSSTSSYENSSSVGTSDLEYWADKNRNSSPPMAKSAAFCIMRLEELERNIEKTIREKFPDAEPFLIRKRTPPDDSSRGSKSLPTTPSPKKKMLITHEIITDTSQIESVTSTLEAASNKLGHAIGATRYYDETFEESVRPVMSPVVLRRFGARTRHASISPKIQRAKTAALYNSPSEMERVTECSSPVSLESPPNESVTHHQVSAHPSKGRTNQSFQGQGHYLVRQERIELSESEEDTPRGSYSYIHSRDHENQNVQNDKIEKEKEKGGIDTHSFDKPVIVPSVSAVFGSVSPKLKRHAQAKIDDQNTNNQARSFNQTNCDTTHSINTAHAPIGKKSESVDSALEISRSEHRGQFYLGGQSKSENYGRQFPNQNLIKKDTPTPSPISSASDQSVASSSSVKSRVATINKTISEERAGSGEGSGGYPFHSFARASDQVKRTGKAAGGLDSSFHLRKDETKQHSETKEGTNEKLATTPGTRRKHSTDHVIFGSAVALPCRLYSKSISPPSSPERMKGTSNNNFKYSASNLDPTSREHTESNAGVVCDRNVQRREGQVDLSANTPSTQSQHSICVCKELTALSDRRVESHLNITKDTISVRSEYSGDNKNNIDISNSSNGRDVKTGDHSSLVSHSVYSGKHNITSNTNSSRDFSSGQTKIRKDFSSGSFDEKCCEKVIEDEQPIIVLKQPVSKVISDMINSSIQRQNHQQRQQRNWQANPTTPEKDAMHVEPAVAMVTTPSFRQECLALEEKRVVNGSACTPYLHCASDLKEEERRKQAKEFSLNDEVMKTHSGEKEMECVEERTTDSVRVAKTGTSSETSEGSDLDGFLQNVKKSEKITLHDKTTANEMPLQSSIDNTDQKPPPPSPTNIEKASELLEEEEEEEEENKKEILEEVIGMNGKNKSGNEVNLALVRQNEMRAFSDEICQRLSDFLSSHTGSDEVFVGTDGREEDEEEEGEEEMRKRDVFLENDQTKERPEECRDDLRKHWENPGLLSELSEDHLTETIEPTIPANDTPPVHDIRPSRFSTSSSLSTSTSSSTSSSGLFAPPSLPPTGKNRVEQDYFTYQQPEDDYEYFDDDTRNRRDTYARSCHSDDDVARGGGIPDYYDDKPLWKKRQKPPGQLSIAMAAMRRRERRERWLKKRQRNRTDLLSTGSSDMGSEQSLRQGSRLSFGDSTGSNECEDDDEVIKTRSPRRHFMGSGVLSSPKYSKPIMPFLGSDEIAKKSPPEANEEIITPEKVGQRLTSSYPVGNYEVTDDAIDDSGDRDSSTISRSTDHTLCEEHSQSLETLDELDDHRSSFTSTSTEKTTTTTTTTSTTDSHSHIAIPGLEETFDELMSVKQILEELQDRTPSSSAGAPNVEPTANSTNNSNKLLPLTIENIKSIKEFYKDNGGNGRRSRMSNTDRTESDLDLFSEYRDDASTDSNLYADDEDDGDNNDLNTTADELVGGATGGEQVESFVVSCTFYNSNSVPPDCASDNKRNIPFETDGSSRIIGSGGISCTNSETPSIAFSDRNSNRGGGNRNIPVQSAGASYGRSNSAPSSRSGNQMSLSRDAGAAGFNSDEEFWAGRAAFERSYRQLETAADAVSSTFQNAREQMIDIQHHLQALRRQMEGLQEDLTSTSYTLTPDYSAFDSK